MATQKQIEANRINALKSTGPKTDAGKVASSLNALKHGLRAEGFAILPGEDLAKFTAFAEAMVRDMQPVGVLQREIVDDVIQTRWKIKRIPGIEAEMMRQRQAYLEGEYQRNVRLKRVKPEELPATAPLEILAGAFQYEDNAYTRLELYRARLTRSMHTALREWRKLREETAGAEEVLVGGSVSDAGNSGALGAEKRPGLETRATEAGTMREASTEQTASPTAIETPSFETISSLAASAAARAIAARTNEPNFDSKSLSLKKKPCRPSSTASIAAKHPASESAALNKVE